MLMTVQQSQLIHENGTQCKTTGGHQPTSGYLSMPIKDAFEVLVEILDCHRAQFVEDASHFYSIVIVGVRVRPMLGGYQPPPLESAYCPHQWRVVMSVSQHVPYAGRQRALAKPYKLGSFDAIVMIGRGKLSSQRYPHVSYYRNEVEFPPIHPPVPTRFGPMSLSVNGGVRHFALFSMFAVPYSAFGSEYRAVGGSRSAASGPGLDQGHQMATQSTNLSRQSVRKGFEATFPRSAGGITPCSV
jgi:hypothetical protein